MSENITQLSDAELDAVGAGLYINVDLSTNIYKSKISQYNSSHVSTYKSYVDVNQSNNVGTTVVVDL